MKAFSFRLESSLDPVPEPSFPGQNATIVLAFGLREHIEDPSLLGHLKEAFPNAEIVGASTAGEIFQFQFKSESVVGLALELEKSECRVVSRSSSAEDDFCKLGRDMGQMLAGKDLQMVLVFAEGLEVDCDDLLRGLDESLVETKPLIFGGLAGDSLDFEETVLLNSEGNMTNGVVAVGFYGSELEIRSAVSSTYSDLGPPHQVTRADGNLLIEVDGRRALDVLVDEVGPLFEDSEPSNSGGFDFPMVFANEKGEPIFARTPMYIDEAAGTLLYAGSLPLGRFRFSRMQGNRDLLEGALSAAQKTSMHGSEEFVFMVSCAARRLALGVAVGAELDEVCPLFTTDTPAIGFYAYGEIGHSEGSKRSEIFNHSFNLVACREA